MIPKIKKIPFSKRDLSRNITIPNQLNVELAELIGIIIGDGHVGKYKTKTATHYTIEIDGNIKEKEYYQNYINSLIEKNFNIRFNTRIREEKNSITLRLNSKAIYYFLSEIFKIPQRKNKIKIPKIILKSNKKIKKAFIRGVADTDFSFTIKKSTYPVIQGASKSEELIIQISDLLNELNIKNNTQKEKTPKNKSGKSFISYRIYINGHERTNKFIKEIGFSSSKRKNERARRDSNPRSTA